MRNTTPLLISLVLLLPFLANANDSVAATLYKDASSSCAARLVNVSQGIQQIMKTAAAEGHTQISLVMDKLAVSCSVNQRVLLSALVDDLCDANKHFFVACDTEKLVDGNNGKKGFAFEVALRPDSDERPCACAFPGFAFEAALRPDSDERPCASAFPSTAS